MGKCNQCGQTLTIFTAEIQWNSTIDLLGEVKEKWIFGVVSKIMGHSKLYTYFKVFSVKLNDKLNENLLSSEIMNVSRNFDWIFKHQIWEGDSTV